MTQSHVVGPILSHVTAALPGTLGRSDRGRGTHKRIHYV